MMTGVPCPSDGMNGSGGACIRKVIVVSASGVAAAASM
jgi:hypothetical protein